MSARISTLGAGRLWRWHLFWGQTFRTIVTGNHGTVAAVLTVFTLLLATIPPVRHPLSEYLHKYGVALSGGVAALLLLLAMLLSTLVISRLALRSMTPEDYARIMIGGRPPSETLQVISHKIRRACKPFLDGEKHLTNLRPDPKEVERLKKKFGRQHRALLNISALLELASKELDIPEGRLKDYVFEYDPDIHRKYFQRAIQNSELIVDLQQEIQRRRAELPREIARIEIIGDAQDVQRDIEKITKKRTDEADREIKRIEGRKEGLCDENKRVFGSTKDVIEAQKAILDYTGVHVRVLQVAATRSTFGRSRALR